MPLTTKPQRGEPVLVDQATGYGSFSVMGGRSGPGGSVIWPFPFINGWADTAGNDSPSGVLRWGPIVFMNIALTKAAVTAADVCTLHADFIPPADFHFFLAVTERKSNENKNPILILQGAGSASPGLLTVFQYDATLNDEYWGSFSYWVGL